MALSRPARLHKPRWRCQLDGVLRARTRCALLYALLRVMGASERVLCIEGAPLHEAERACGLCCGRGYLVVYLRWWSLLARRTEARAPARTYLKIMLLHQPSFGGAGCGL